MYLAYYGFKESPFDITPNPRFLFFSHKHREAFNHLLYGIQHRKGFVELTGEVGAGKTTLCRAVLEQLGPQFKTALILNPVLTPKQLLKAILMELGLKPQGKDRFDYITQLNQYLIEQAMAGNEVVLLIDDAQAMSDDLLEHIRLLSNLETTDRKLLQIVLLGQPELKEKLSQPSLRQLRQRITVRYHLKPLDEEETANYLQHRLTTAGANGSPRFDTASVQAIHKYSNGIPRLVNALADKTLLAGYVFQTGQLTKALVYRAIAELEGERS